MSVSVVCYGCDGPLDGPLGRSSAWIRIGLVVQVPPDPEPITDCVSVCSPPCVGRAIVKLANSWTGAHPCPGGDA